jgi:hypothetical protein
MSLTPPLVYCFRFHSNGAHDLAEVVRHAVTSHRQISGKAVTSAFTAIHPVLNRNQRRYHVKILLVWRFQRIRPLVLLKSVLLKWRSVNTAVSGVTSVPMQFHPPKIWHGSDRDRNHASAVTGRWLKTEVKLRDILFVPYREQDYETIADPLRLSQWSDINFQRSKQALAHILPMLAPVKIPVATEIDLLHSQPFTNGHFHSFTLRSAVSLILFKLHEC